ncbi:glycosyltransferase [Chelativorans sp. AA-79]|uniref:glycosyltransferase family 2 protein n=1 Tax=Chelativorans sp. AA-79 TaxID=3028735 RepID=UPI0023F9F0D2|nr:glycosyltransferase [Chelativorans sp. AA-79]WEX09081.1 glycosyltransferase [Chelativorans sp. AA-79]
MYVSSSGGTFEKIDRPVDLPKSMMGLENVAPSGLAEWQPILERLGMSLREMRDIDLRARLAGVYFQGELLASGSVSEVDLFHALALYLGLPFDGEVSPESLLLLERQNLRALRLPYGTGPVIAMRGLDRTTYLIAPERLDIVAMQSFLHRRPSLGACLRIVTPSALRRAIRDRSKKDLAHIAVHGLFEKAPDLSARHVLNAWQGIAMGAVTTLAVTGLALAPSAALVTLHVVLSLFFFICVALRVAVSQGARNPTPPAVLRTMRAEQMPVYTVLVALYKEAEVVPELLVSLGRLVWPRSKLEIKLVCESDDLETLAAIRAQELRPWVEVIEVPPRGPRTKPKALSYALPMTTGEFVVLFDAEDRPHPFQLAAAWERFRTSAEDLACLQAPLVITNRREGWIASMFALEYSALFQGMLPWLARRNLVLPLGGTSNHFRRSVLEEIGGWDPYNVTEDADLGLRLARRGYRTGTIGSPTYEDAPTAARVWLPQRTRWFKGWAQTWLVHMRDVPRLYRELGGASFAVVQILTLGMWLSALAYAGFVLSALVLISLMLAGGPQVEHYAALLALDATNVIFGHGAFLALGWRTMPKTEQRGFWRHVLLVPLYWLLLSAAAWRALWQLYRCPHAWEKTPHRARRRRGQES